LVSLDEIIRASVADLEPHVPLRIELDETTRTQRFQFPPRAVSQAIRGLVKNAIDASPDGSCVRLRAGATLAGVRIEVEDRGPGMPPEVLARAGEPFFTTKPPGKGMGLGLFLSRAVVERLGGELELSSRPGVGTTAIVSLPAAPVAARKQAEA